MLRILIWWLTAIIVRCIYWIYKVLFLKDTKGDSGKLIIVGILMTLLIYIVLKRVGFEHPILWAILGSSSLWDAGYQVVKKL